MPKARSQPHNSLKHSNAPTNPNRDVKRLVKKGTATNTTGLRSSATIKRLQMYKTKPIRDKKGSFYTYSFPFCFFFKKKIIHWLANFFFRFYLFLTFFLFSTSAFYFYFYFHIGNILGGKFMSRELPTDTRIQPNRKWFGKILEEKI